MVSKKNVPKDLNQHAEKYLGWMLERNYSALTVRQKKHHLNVFLAWCDERDVSSPQGVSKALLEGYQRHLFRAQKRNGRKLSFKTQHGVLVNLRVFFKWLCKQGYLANDPSAGLELPKIGYTLPRAILTIDEVESILSQPDISRPLGLRDRAIMEVLYSTGVRRFELINMKIFDFDPEKGTVMVFRGKGKRDRVVPIGSRAIKWLDKYMEESRPKLRKDVNESSIFLGYRGGPLTPGGVGNVVKAYFLKAGVGKVGACHLFRHTMATEMVSSGADIRCVQQILGHTKIETTQIYVNIGISKIKEIHTATHPAERVKK